MLRRMMFDPTKYYSKWLESTFCASFPVDATPKIVQVFRRNTQHERSNRNIMEICSDRNISTMCSNRNID